MLPNRRGARIVTFVHEGRSFRATFGEFPDGRLGEVFLDAGKPDSALQSQADDAGVLVSLLLQHGVAPAHVRHSISGPIALAMDIWLSGLQ